MRLNISKANIAHHGQDVAGVPIHYFLSSFDDEFHKPGNEGFKRFLNKNKHITKWMIFSDYAFYDQEKPNDVVTFSIIPYQYDFYDFGDFIGSISFKDAKKLKAIKKNFINFINSNEILSLSIILPPKRRLDPINEREMLKSRFKMVINMAKHWIKNEGEKEYYKEILKKYKEMLAELNKAGANLKYVRDMDIVASFVSYISFQICQENRTELVGWFSDRDAILDYKINQFKKPLIFDLIDNLFHVLMFNIDENYKERIVYGVPEKNGPVWYDNYNRIPDLIAAALSDFDFNKSKCTNEKFKPVMERLMTNSDKNIVYRLDVNDGELTASIIDTFLVKG
ncbi:hypothetical protein [Serratia fonticola]|uniref:Uncharacterized protein n=1 Tax=Serratia fonticola TaxID=47917 RepID=A0AAW3WTH0_SERFO|nr:hypothetical protein [Serratia fonticola]MBC3212922.1 hypothetical protein [Serratia fonticola]NYA14486.1 hypothetical protein [Serratia fonticola]NYA34284.1 hypothetical protein [Serratia fonticola]